MENNTEAISTLNHLIEVNTKRFERYKHAADRVKNINRKLLFMNYAIQSQEFINNLNKWLIALGSISISLSGSSHDSFLSRTWNNLKVIVSEKKFIVDDCADMEKQSIQVYKKALNNATITLPSATLADIQKQTNELQEAYSMITSLRENPAAKLQVA